jgi:hypothetical protein
MSMVQTSNPQLLSLYLEIECFIEWAIAVDPTLASFRRFQKGSSDSEAQPDQFKEGDLGPML